MPDSLVSVSISQDGSKLVELLQKVAQLTEPSNILDKASAVVLNRIRQRFLREVDTAEQPWEPSKAAIRRRLKGGTGTLYDTGNLFRSIQQAGVEGTETRITTDVEYAKYHQFGIGGNLKREFMGVSEADARIVERVLQKYLDDSLGDFYNDLGIR